MNQSIETKKKAFANSAKNYIAKGNEKGYLKPFFVSYCTMFDLKIEDIGEIQMKEFMYGVVYIVERTETSIEAFELLSRGKDFVEIYIREYTPETNELIAYEVRLHVTNDGFQEFVTYKKDIPASQHYDGKISIFTKEGLKNYDEEK